MRRIQPRSVLVVTIAEQIIDAPVESVVIVKGTYCDALVKTGSDGYRSARGEGYLHHDDIANWVEDFGKDVEFYFAE